MVLLKEELKRRTGLSEKEIKKRLLANALELERPRADEMVEAGGCKKDSWAYLSRCYGASDATIVDRMVNAIK